MSDTFSKPTEMTEQMSSGSKEKDEKERLYKHTEKPELTITAKDKRKLQDIDDDEKPKHKKKYTIRTASSLLKYEIDEQDRELRPPRRNRELRPPRRKKIMDDEEKHRLKTKLSEIDDEEKHRHMQGSTSFDDYSWRLQRSRSSYDQSGSWPKYWELEPLPPSVRGFEEKKIDDEEKHRLKTKLSEIDDEEKHRSSRLSISTSFDDYYSNAKVLKQLIREQFYYLVTMVDISSIVREIPELRYFIYDKPEAILLTILMSYEKLIPAMIKQIQDRKPDVYETLKTKMSPFQKIAAEKHLCDKCSSTQYFQFLSECPDVMGVSIELFQSGHIEPNDLLSLYNCSTKIQQSETFREISRKRSIDFAHFIAAVLNMTEKNISEAKDIIQKLNDVLCEDLRSTFNLVPILQEERKVTVAVESSKSKTNIPQSKSKKQTPIRNQETKQDSSNSTSTSTVFAVVKLQRGNGQHFERSFVETLIERKDKINSEIETYGKIERVHLGCIELILQLRGESDDETEKTDYCALLLHIVQHICEDESLKNKLGCSNIKLGWKVNVSGKKIAEKDLWKKKCFIILNYDVISSEIHILSFEKEFDRRKIMDRKTFRQTFQVKLHNKKCASDLFLNFILESGIDVMEAFVKVIKEDSIYEFVAELFDQSLQSAKEYDAKEDENYPKEEENHRKEEGDVRKEEGNDRKEEGNDTKEEGNDPKEEGIDPKEEGNNDEIDANTAGYSFQHMNIRNNGFKKTNKTAVPKQKNVNKILTGINDIISHTRQTLSESSQKNNQSLINISNVFFYQMNSKKTFETDRRKTYKIKSDITQIGNKNAGTAYKLHNQDEEEESDDEIEDEEEED